MSNKKPGTSSAKSAEQSAEKIVKTSEATSAVAGESKTEDEDKELTPEQKEAKELRKENKVKLSDGRIAQVSELYGSHAVSAQARCEGDKEIYTKCLIADAVTIDGKKIVMEDVDTIPLKDFNAIFVIHSELNF